MNTDGVHKTGADSFRGLRWALACLAACLVAGCSHANLSDHAADCVDLDGDGYGAGCARGSDCDDTNPGVTTGCARCLHDGIPGCECSQPGGSAPCGASVGSTGGELLCGQGQSTCVDGRWGECVITNSVTMGPTSPGMAVKGYGTPAPVTGILAIPTASRRPTRERGSPTTPVSSRSMEEGCPSSPGARVEGLSSRLLVRAAPPEPAHTRCVRPERG